MIRLDRTNEISRNVDINCNFPKISFEKSNYFSFKSKIVLFKYVFPNLYDYARNVQAAWSDFLKYNLRNWYITDIFKDGFVICILLDITYIVPNMIG